MAHLCTKIHCGPPHAPTVMPIGLWLLGGLGPHTRWPKLALDCSFLEKIEKNWPWGSWKYVFLGANSFSVHVQAHFMGTKLLHPIASPTIGGGRVATSFTVQLHFHIWQRYGKPNPNPNIVTSLPCSNYFSSLPTPPC